MKFPTKTEDRSPSVDLGTIHDESREKEAIGEIKLVAFAFEQQVPREIGTLEIICIGWNICNSWAGVSRTLALTIALGGSVTPIYGAIVCFIMVGCSGLTMAELVSAYPTAGGQYHWTSILSPAKTSRILSYVCGMTNVYAWIASTSGVAILTAQGIVAVVISYQPNYVPQTWHYFLIFQAVNILAFIHNIFTLRRTLWINDVSFFLTLAGFLAITVTCLAKASPKQPSEFVWTNFVNDSGWPDGISFLTGLVSPNYMYAGLDGAIHLCEECKNPESTVPKAIVSTLCIGFVTTFAFTLSMIYCIVDFEAVINTPTRFPIYEIWHQATRSRTATVVFMATLLVAAIVALSAAQQTASRLTWSFARDNALVGSKFISRIDPKLDVPLWGLVANNVIVAIIGCVYLGSSTAFNAFIGTGLILQQVSYAIPAALLMYRRRQPKVLPRNRPFRLWGPLGWVVNTLTVVFALIVLVFYNLPVILPATGSNMNYTSAVIGAMGLFAALNWLIHGQELYHGPRLAKL